MQSIRNFARDVRQLLKMRKERNYKLLIIQFAVVLLLIALDQATKYWALESLKPIRVFPIIEDVFNLRFAENTGAAFSMLQGKRVLLTVLPSAASIFMVYLLVSDKIKSKFGTWGITLVLSGAIGNLIDRAFRGKVIDMFDFELINFPVFNVADICVSVGAVLIFIYAIFFSDNKAEKKDE